MPLIVKLTCQGKTVEAHLGADRLATTALADLPRLADIFRWPKEGIYYDPMPGKRLYAALGGEALCRRLDESEDGLLLLQIEEDRLRALPWEYAIDEEAKPLVTRYACLRLVTGRRAAPPQTGELRLLFCGADPLVQIFKNAAGEIRHKEADFHLEFDRERKAIRGALQTTPAAIRAHNLPPTVEQLRQSLAMPGAAILHLSCHGAIGKDPSGRATAALLLEDEDGAVVLRLEDEDGAAGLLKGDLLAQMAGRGVLRLVLLSACHTAEGEREVNLAYALVCDGLPAVIGMQESFPVDQSDSLAAALYPLLLSGCDLGEALRQVRLALFLERAWAAGLPVAYVQEGGWAALPVREGLADLSGMEGPGVCRLPQEVQPPRPLLGRDAAQWQVAGLLHEHNVTITGAGGMGKTVLAAAVAERFAWRWTSGVAGHSFAGGVEESSFLVRLWEILRPGQPLPRTDELKASILQAGRNWDGLLLLDNYESVLNGVAEKEAEAEAIHRLVTQLAEGGMRLLLTSRERPAGLRNEAVYPEEGGLAGLAEESGIELFLEHSPRACAAEEEELAREVWQSVSGYPLAILLLAGQYEVEKHLTAAEFLEGWEEQLHRAHRPGLAAHQQCLAAVLERSLAALGAEKAERYRQLSVLAFPFLVQGAALVWGRGLDEADLAAVRQELGELERRNLLEVIGRDEDGRAQVWQMMPALQQEAARGRRAEVAGLGEYGIWLGEVGYEGIDRHAGLAQVLRSSLAALEAGRQVRSGEDRLWHERRYGRILVRFGELERAAQLLKAAEAQAAPGSALRATLLFELAGILVTRGELAEAERLYRQSLETWEALGDVKGKGATLHELAGIFVVRGELAEAERLYRQVLEIVEALGDVQGKGATLTMLGQLLLQQGKQAEGLSLLEQALRLLEGMGAVADAAQVREILQQVRSAAAAEPSLPPQVYQALPDGWRGGLRRAARCGARSAGGASIARDGSCEWVLAVGCGVLPAGSAARSAVAGTAGGSAGAVASDA